MNTRLGWLSEVLGDSPTLKLSAQAQELLARGEPVVNLTAGEPDFPTPLAIREAAHSALDWGRHGYGPTAGLPDLRRRVAEHYAEKFGLGLGANETIVSNGAKQVLYNALSMLLDEGDGVAVPVPHWVTYPAQIAALRGEMIPVHPSRPGWKVCADDLERAGAGKAKALILNTPNNPSGAVYSRAELEDIAEFCRAHPIWVLTDEIYEDLAFNPAGHVSLMTVAPDLRHRTIVITGLSKSYAMTGWRVGFGIADARTIQAMTRLQSHSTSCVNVIAQRAAITAFDCREEMLKMAAAFRVRRDLMVAGLQGIDGVKFDVPDGAFYLFLDVSELMDPERSDGGGWRLAEHLLRQEKLATVPGEPFGVPNHLRLSYSASDNVLQEAIIRFRRGVASFTG